MLSNCTLTFSPTLALLPLDGFLQLLGLHLILLHLFLHGLFLLGGRSWGPLQEPSLPQGLGLGSRRGGSQSCPPQPGAPRRRGSLWVPGDPHLEMLQLPPVILELPPFVLDLRLTLPLLLQGRERRSRGRHGEGVGTGHGRTGRSGAKGLPSGPGVCGTSLGNTPQQAWYHVPALSGTN